MPDQLIALPPATELTEASSDSSFENHGAEVLELPPRVIEARRTPEQDLISAAQSGDSVALNELLAQYQPRILAYCHKRVFDFHSAEDAAQEVAIRIIRGLSLYDPAIAKFDAWVFSIARNYCSTSCHARRFDFADLEQIENDVIWQGSTVDEASRHEQSERLVLAQRKLPQNHRRAIEAELMGDSHSEAAARLDVRLGTLKSWTKRAIAQLRDLLSNRPDKS